MGIVKKVIIAGHFGVGKTSLVRQFIYEKFSGQYLTTIGVKIDKKVVEIDGTKVKMILWDIAGESTTIKIPQKYMSGAQGLIYVFDMSREETYENIETDMFEINKNMKTCPSIILGNKSDLMSPSEIIEIKQSVPVEFSVSSAKSGENVEEAFIELAYAML